MVSIIFQSIKLAPRLLFQAYLQPSKVHDFLDRDEEISQQDFHLLLMVP
ncbi:MAG: hypothetical protein KAW12_25735 [Candidatus Aminicenantes bacterium]|nr:hypothetical protein [Candidatus Aminicenantes bacterium]